MPGNEGNSCRIDMHTATAYDKIANIQFSKIVFITSLGTEGNKTKNGEFHNLI
jgi:hypothetical protein